MRFEGGKGTIALVYQSNRTMPVIQSAKKALRRDRKREAHNAALRTRLGHAVKAALEEPSQDTVSAAHSVIDRAAKKRVIHPNRSARLKSRVGKRIAQKKTT